MRFLKNTDHDQQGPAPRNSSSVLLDSNNTIDGLRAQCPLPVLMTGMGMKSFIRKSCRSPFRPDTHPSWGVFQRDGRWFWKDHGTGEDGDEADFIVRARNLSGPDAFPKALEYWAQVAADHLATPDFQQMPVAESKVKPDITRFGLGSADQLERLAQLRGIDARGLLVAHDRQLLVFGRLGPHEVFGIKDSSGNVLEVRRLDGEPFPAYGDLSLRKSHALKGSRKSWPVGIADAGTRPMILLVEGLPDFLAAFEVVVREDALDRVAPVAMLTAGSKIADDALPLFKDRQVRIVPHADRSGHAAGRTWRQQLIQAGASKVDFFNLADDSNPESPIKDLNDYLPVYRLVIASRANEGRIL